MRKYRLTKLTVKTREIISITNQTKDSDCPLCHSSLSAFVPVKESSAGSSQMNKESAELPPAKLGGDAD